MKNTLYFIFLLVILGSVACGESSDESDTNEEMVEVTEPEIIGNYMDDYMASHVISASSWTQSFGEGIPSVFNFRKVDNEQDFLIAENDAMNEYSPSLFSRFDWVVVEGNLWYCQTIFDAESAEVAEATPAADATDPSAGGCGMYPWSALSSQ